MRARGPRTAPLSGAGGLDSHRQVDIFCGFESCPFRGRVYVLPAAGNASRWAVPLENIGNNENKNGHSDFAF